MKPQNTSTKFLAFFLFFFLFALLIHFFLTSELALVSYAEAKLQISDFAYHILLVRAYWFEGLTYIYEFPVQQQVLSSVAGVELRQQCHLG